MQRTGFIGAIGAFIATALLTIAFAAVPVTFADSIARKGKVAADTAADAPVSWTGFHASGSVGYGFTRTEFEDFQNGEGRVNTDNVLLSGGVGWDMQVSNMVVGLMGDVTVSDLGDDAEWKWALLARAGVLVTPKTLAYVLAGYTETIDGQLAFKSNATTSFKDLAGLTLGGGLEHVFGAGWAARAEYRYISYGNETAPAGVQDGLLDGSKIESGEHQVRLGVVKRFLMTPDIWTAAALAVALALLAMPPEDWFP